MYYGQVIAIYIKKNLMMLEREDEIIRFQGIILMLMHADKIIVLEDGEAIGIGTHDELIASCPVYREIYATQFSEVENG